MISKVRSKHIIKFILFFICFERLLETIGAPHAIIFIIDFLNIILLVNLAVSKGLKNLVKLRMVRIHIALLVIGIAVALLNGVSILLILWSLRNLGRFYIFFGACIKFLKEEEYRKIYKALEIILYIDVVMIILQYAMGYRGDFLGGLFGTTTGANAYSNALFVIVCGYSIACMLQKKKASFKELLPVIMSLIISIITETKVFLFELPLIILINVLIIGIVERRYKVILKGFAIGALAVVAIILGSKYIAKLYPSASNLDFLSVEGLRYILTRESGYTGFGDLNRLTAITTLNKMDFFDGDYLHRIFGKGLGAAEYSESIRALQSVFYQQYQNLHYYWFSHAWMYIECGYLGLALYVIGIYSNYPAGIKLIRTRKVLGANTSLIVSGLVTCGICALILIYNQSFRIETAYLYYFSIAGIFSGGGLLNGKAKPISKHHSSNI